MSAALVAMSHTPLLGKVPVDEEITADLDTQFAELRAAVEAFDPTLIVLFAPDHYNGFFYDVMPPYCVGLTADSIGDFGSAQGSLRVPSDLAEQLAEHVLGEGYDVSVSREMLVDHGAVQPLEILFDSLDSCSVIPVFVNGVARPFAPMSRVRGLGRAIGSYFANSTERVLFLASGGLSHDPPVPQWNTASNEARAFLIKGRHPTPEARASREKRVFATAADFALGQATIQDLNPNWDRDFMNACASADFGAIDSYTADAMDTAAGHSSHEVRTWVAAFGAMDACGTYSVVHQYYRPIREYIAGFGLMAARTATDLGARV